MSDRLYRAHRSGRTGDPVELFRSALCRYRAQSLPRSEYAPTPTNRGFQTVPHPPATALHRRFSHKEYYRHTTISLTTRIRDTTQDSATRPTSTKKMPSANAVCVRYHGRNTVITSAPYSSGTDSRRACARRTIPPSSVIAIIKKAYIMFHASFCDLWHVTISGQTLQGSVL